MVADCLSRVVVAVVQTHKEQLRRQGLADLSPTLVECDDLSEYVQTVLSFTGCATCPDPARGTRMALCKLHCKRPLHLRCMLGPIAMILVGGCCCLAYDSPAGQLNLLKSIHTCLQAGPAGLYPDPLLVEPDVGLHACLKGPRMGPSMAAEERQNAPCLPRPDSDGSLSQKK